MRRLDCHDRLKNVRRGYEAATRTVNVVIRFVKENPAVGREIDLTVSDLRTVASELHDVYFARMFASFESSIRHYWASIRKTKPLTEVC